MHRLVGTHSKRVPNGRRATIVAIAQAGNFPAKLFFQLNGFFYGEFAIRIDDLRTTLGNHLAAVIELDKSLRVHNLLDAYYDVHYILLAWFCAEHIRQVLFKTIISMVLTD